MGSGFEDVCECPAQHRAGGSSRTRPRAGLILAGLHSGQWLGDVASLQWESVNFNTATLTLTTQKTSRRQIIDEVSFSWSELDAAFSVRATRVVQADARLFGTLSDAVLEGREV